MATLVFTTLRFQKVFTTFILTSTFFVRGIHLPRFIVHRVLFNPLRLSHKILLASQQEAYGTTSAQ